MGSNQLLIISFWNPTKEHPQQGIFIQEQAAAVCRQRDNVIFLQFNVLPSPYLLFRKSINESAWYQNKMITINLYTRLWKFWYVNPWALERIIFNYIKSRGNEIHPAIIHSNVIFPCGVVGYLLARRMGVRMIISEHWSKAEKLLKHPLYRRIAIKAYNYSDSIICVSEFLSAKISAATGHKKIVVIPNIIDTDIFTWLPKPSGSDRPFRMMCVASWKKPKRLDLIFDAICAYVKESSNEIELTVVGKGVQVDIFKTMKTPDKLKIIWAGYLEKPSIASLLQSADLFLHASDIETFSIVTAEALATGTPVLASNTGALPELINEHNGLLAENTAAGWLNGIREIIAKKYDSREIAMVNREKYSPDLIGNCIISCYKEIESHLSKP